MALHTATTSVERISDDDPMPTQITFTFEITDDGQLMAITAKDNAQQSYLVSIKLTNPNTNPQCCCPTPEGMKCFSSSQCNCDPL
jgi:hypothetical protein